MSSSAPVRAVLRRSRLPTFAPTRASQRCISQTSPRRDGDGSNKNDSAATVAPEQHPDVQRAMKAYRRSFRGRTTVPATGRPAKEDFPPYTAEEMAFLARKYTPEQMEAIKLGEAAVDPQDLHDQGVLRSDGMKVDYLDDFSRIHEVLDKKRQHGPAHEDTNLRYKTDDELDEDLARWVDGLPADADRVEWLKFEDSHRMMVGKEEAERLPNDYLAPALPKLTDPVVKRVAKKVDEAEFRGKAMYEALSKQTGLPVRYMRSLRVRTLVQHRVVNQTRMGKVQSEYFLSVAGNGNGLIGIGEGKHTEMEQAQLQSVMKAIRNMQPVPRYESRTIYGDMRGKVSATTVELYNRPPGFGIRCQEKIYEICKCAGISDLAAKVVRGKNPMNTIKATVQALMKQRLPEDVALARGKKMVDVRKVYYAGAN